MGGRSGGDWEPRISDFFTTYPQVKSSQNLFSIDP